jgi:hypothetical protein
MFSIHCPHCGKELQLLNDRAGSRVRCSACDQELQAPEAEEPDGELAYTLNEKGQESPSNDQAYVENVTRKAAKERKRKPPSRNRFPVDLIAGLLLVACGIGFSLFVIFGGGGLFQAGLMNAFVCGLLFPLIFIITGAMCIVSWWK